MKRTDFNRLIEETNRKIAALTATKGRDYAGDEDALSNFKEEARALLLTPEQIWHVYHAKHYSAVTAYCREGKVESEPIEGRILDMILYGHLLLGLVRDAQEPRINVGGLFRGGALDPGVGG